MRSAILRVLLMLSAVCSLDAQSAPLVDHHQHLFSPEMAASFSELPTSLDPRPLPADLDRLLQTRGRVGQDAGAAVDIYTVDAVMARSGGPTWLRGREAIVAWWKANRTPPLRLMPVAWHTDRASGSIAAYVTTGPSEAPRYVSHTLLSLRREDATWRISAEGVIAPGPRVVSPISADRLVALMDTAGIRRAVVLSVAYIWGSPLRPVDNEYAKVRAENDWTSQQVERFPDRLRGFCSVNPLRDYAVAEVSRCAKELRLGTGLKLHFGSSDVDLRDPAHVQRLQRVMRSANDLGMAIIVHMRPAPGRPYGAADARIVLDSLVPAAPDVALQIAHLAGTGPGYTDAQADEALSVFADAIGKRDPRTQRLYFDVTTNVDLNISRQQAELVATRLRQLGLDRILYGSDAAAEPNLPPRQGWAAFRQLPLTEEEFIRIANNRAPYMD